MCNVNRMKFMNIDKTKVSTFTITNADEDDSCETSRGKLSV